MKKNEQNDKTISARTAHGILKDLAGTGSRIPFSGRIQGNSMLPWIKDSDTIKIFPLAAPLKIGDIVAFYGKSNSQFIAHRVIRLTQNHIITKGDNCLAPDLPLTREDIAGKITEVKRGTNCITFGMGIERFLIALMSRLNILQTATRVLKKARSILY